MPLPLLRREWRGRAWVLCDGPRHEGVAKASGAVLIARSAAKGNN